MAISEEQRYFFVGKQRKVEKTAYIRFNVAEKLANDERVSMVFSAGLTTYLICSSILLFADGSFSSTLNGRAVSLVGILASISLLVANFIDGTKGRSLKADIMLRNAQSILKISSVMDLELRSDDPSYDRLSEQLVRYQDALGEAGINHDAWDNAYFEAAQGATSASLGVRFCSWVKFLKLRWLKLVFDWWFHFGVILICLAGFVLLAQHAISLF